MNDYTINGDKSVVSIMIGDASVRLRDLPDNHFHCVVTSPPYWGLRNYGIDGQIGQEGTLAAYLDRLTEMFEQVRRVLRPDGTLFLNIGDSYARAGGTTDNTALTRKRDLAHMSSAQRRMSKLSDGFKDKDLCMIPNRLAIRLQDQGWWVRSEIIWNKPNAMPFSGNDRPASAHEKVWLLTKQKRYHWDKNAVREDSGAMLRNVWTIPVVPYPGEHDAVFPPALAERAIALGCPVGGRVLDPCGGAGTTAVAALKLARDCTLIELNPVYAAQARKRVAETADKLSNIIGAWALPLDA